jgi:outer membrane protein TolC
MRRLVWLAPFLLVATLRGQVPEDSPRLAALVRDGHLYLSLHDAIALALENNLDVELQRIGPQLAATDVRRAQAGALLRGVPLFVREGPKSATGAGGDVPAALIGPGPDTSLSIGNASALGPPPPSRDPLLSARVGRSRTTSPQVNSFQVGTTSLVTDTTAWNLAWQKGFLSGGTLSISFENAHQALNHLRYDLTPFTTASLGVTFAQPLLRGFGTRLNSRFIQIARNTSRQSDLVFRQQVVSTTAAVIRLYWDLVSLTQDVEARRQALERAEKLLRDNREQADVGTRAPIEVVRARAEVARAQRDVIAAESLRRQQETLVKDYLSRKTVSDPGWADVSIMPTDALTVDPSEPIPPAATLAGRALKDRPDILQAKIQIESTRAGLEGSRNALRPSLDLVASARTNGLAGDVNPLVVPGAAPHNPDAILIGGYGTAISQLYRRTFPDYGLSLQFALPLNNRAAEADYARDTLALRQQELRLAQLEKQVHVEIENALIALEQARATLEATGREREFQEQALAAEEEKLGVGVSTTFMVIQYQRDLAQARSTEIAARAGYVKARAAVSRASGALLDDYGLSVAGDNVKCR